MKNTNGAGATPPEGRRTFGRVRVLQMFAPPLAEEPTLDVEGCHLEVIRDSTGVTTAQVHDDAGDLVALVHLFPAAHGDSFYGRYSASDAEYCYGAKLEVTERARGKKLGRQMARIGRCIAYAEGGRGAKSLVAPDNAASLRCHELEDFSIRGELFGIRLGGRVLWLRRRTVR